MRRLIVRKNSIFCTLLILAAFFSACRHPDLSLASPEESGPPPELEPLLLKALDEITNERHEEALGTLHRLQEQARDAGSLELETRATEEMGLVLSTLGQREAAIREYRQALPLLRHLHDWGRLSSVANRLGFETQALDRPQEATEAYEQGRVAARQAQDGAAEATALRGLILATLALHDVGQANAYARQLLALAELQDDDELRQAALKQLGQGATDLGHRLASLRQARAAKDPEAEATALEGLGNLHLKAGESSLAVERFTQLAVLRWEQGDRRGEVRALTLLGQALEEAGAPERAMTCYERSLERSDSPDEPALLEAAHRRLGALALQASALPEAERHLTASRRLLDLRSENSPLVAHLRSIVDSQLATLRRRLANHRQALKIAEGQLAQRQEVHDLQGESDLLLRTAYLLQELGEHEAASGTFQKAQALKQSLAEVEGETLALSGWTETLRSLGDKAATARALRRLVTLLRIQGEPRIEALGWTELAATQLALGDPESAADAAEKALAHSPDNPGVEASALKTLLSVHLARGEETTARQLAERWARAARRTGDAVAEGRALRHMADADTAAGHAAQALQLCGESRELARRNADFPGLQESEKCFGLVYQAIGDDLRASAHAESYTVAARRNDDPLGVAFGLQLAGTIDLESGHFGDAARRLEQATADFRSLNRPTDTQTTELSLAIVDLAEGRPQEAYRRTRSVIEELTSVPSTPQDSFVRNEILVSALSQAARLHPEVGPLEDGIRLARGALRLAEESGDPAMRGMALETLGYLLMKQGRLAEAEERLRDAAETFPVASSTSELLQEIRMAQDRPLAALAIAEQGRRAHPFPDIGSEASFGHAVRKMAKERHHTLVAYSLLYDPAGVSLPRRLAGPRGRLEKTLRIWVVPPDDEVVVREVDLEARRLAGAPPLSELVANVATLLGERPEGTRSGCDPGTPSYLDPTRGAGQVSGDSDRVLAQLHTLLIEPIAAFLPGDPRAPVLVVPHDSLFRVPFAALLGAAGYLVERHTLATTLSIGGWLSKEDPSPGKALHPEEILVVGDPLLSPEERCLGFEPLPDARYEAAEVARLLEARALVGATATRAEVERRLEKARWIHLATHGYLLEDDPEYPGALLLAPDARDRSGLLTAKEIAGLDLAAELVVLSACDTGRGNVTSEGVSGLARAFLAAGAPSLVVSLWNVPDDEAQSLTVDFYRILAKKPDKARALREAMLRAIAEGVPLQSWARLVLIE